MMRQILPYLLLLIFALSCNNDLADTGTSSERTVADLWTFIDENYVYFELKAIDWDARRASYLTRAAATNRTDSLFAICSDMVATLRDGHCFLRSPDQRYRYDYTGGQPMQYDSVVVADYLDVPKTSGGYTYGMIHDSIAYIHSNGFRQLARFEAAMRELIITAPDKIILDLRNNSGGSPAVAQAMAGYFTTPGTPVGSIQHKSGPARDAFSARIELRTETQVLRFDGPVRLLLDQHAYSASSYFAGMVINFSQVVSIGSRTGGGGGAAAAYELPNGWVVGITSNAYRDANGEHVEDGVVPIIDVLNTAAELEMAIDRTLERAIRE